MKSFFKSLLASIIGCGIVLGGLFLIFMIAIVSLASFDGEEKYIVKDNTVLELNLSGILSDRVEKNPFLDFLGDKTDTKLALVDVLNAIDIAKADDNIKGIYINAGAFSAGSASLKEIRDALIDFKKDSDKFVIAYGDMYTQGCYYLATAADKVIMNPEGMLELHGYSSSPMFFKGLLEKIGVEMQIFKVGTFKSAVEPFINDKMSDPNREQVKSYTSDLWKTMLADISEKRGVSPERLNELADMGPFFRESKFMLENKLVDSLMYETDAKKYMKELMGVSALSDKKVPLASVGNLVSVLPAKTASKNDNVIAILYAEGSISQGKSRDGITDKRYVREIEKLKDDDKVKAVVFRVNSGGGSAFASEQIWKAIEDLKAKKPIVVSMGDLAASGGYYISSNANKIFAQPNTITGSIGIFGMFPNIGGLTKNVGLTFDNVKTNKFADFGDLNRPMREDEKALMQGYVERGYDLFLKRCADGRGVSTDSINTIGQGRVWTGNQALALGLVDAIGGLDEAIAEAVEMVGVENNYKTMSYPKPVDFMQAFFTTKKDEFASQIVEDYLGVDFKAFQILKEIKGQDAIQARLPYEFDVQ